jgi:hypothetical protein
MAANRLVQGGHSWGRYVAQASSGTGSKQWLIVDYGQIAGTGTAPSVDKKVASKLLSSLKLKQQTAKQTTKGSISTIRGLLWVIEQMPGLTHCTDQTLTLEHTGFWVSNGLPYYQVWSFLLLISFFFFCTSYP